MIRIFIGKPGGGKSYGALKEIIDELVWGTRTVVTNLALKLPELNEYLQRVYPSADVDLLKRVQILDTDQIAEFWLYRGGPRLDGCALTDAEWAAGKLPDFGPHRGSGVLYVVDEAHVRFDARNTMRAAQALTYYNSQHRKMWDECVFVTQFLDLIDKRVKGFAQEYWEFRNNGLEKFMTWFVMPSYFTAYVTFRPPGPNVPNGEVHRYRLDLRLAECYDTTAGVGISGRTKPKEKKKKGLPIWTIGVPIALGAYVLFKAPDWAASAVVSTAAGGRIAEAVTGNEYGQDTYSELAGQRARLDVPPSSAGGGGARGASAGFGQAERPPELYVKGIVRRTLPSGYAAFTVHLSDGRFLTEADPELRWIGRSWVVLRDGTTLPIGNGRYTVRPEPVRVDPPRPEVPAVVVVEPTPVAPMSAPLTGTIAPIHLPSLR